MAISKEDKANYIQKYGKSAKDTGSISAQVAILTHRIIYITQHLQSNPHDEHSKRGLISLVNQRKNKLNYLKKIDFGTYEKLLESLKIRA